MYIHLIFLTNSPKDGCLGVLSNSHNLGILSNSPLSYVQKLHSENPYKDVLLDLPMRQFPWALHLGGGFTRSQCTCQLNFSNPKPDCFSEKLLQFTYPLVLPKSAHFPTSSSTLDSFQLSNVGHLDSYKGPGSYTL